MNNKLAGIGLALLLAPLYFVSASLLEYVLGVGILFDPLGDFLSVTQGQDLFNLVAPFAFLGGSVLALVLNAYAVLRIDVSREDGEISGTARLRVGFVNIAVVVASSLLLVTLVGYASLENFAPRWVIASRPWTLYSLEPNNWHGERSVAWSR